MPDPINSMPPPLIPLPSPADQHDSTDPFDSLFSEPGPSQSIFVPVKRSERIDHGNLLPTPSSVTSDFGAFVSVPASMDPLQQPLADFDPYAASSSTSSTTAAASGFFERFTVEAKERAEENERRVLSELLEHEDDPLYWLNVRNPSKESDVASSNTPLVELTDSAPDLTHSPRHSSEHEKAPPSRRSHSPPSNFPRHSSSPSLSSTASSTLPRRWMSSLLTNSVPTTTPITRDFATYSHPQRKAGTPNLSHVSPFASHVYVAPTGAPGFAGDHDWNKAGFEFEKEDQKHLRIELTGRRAGTTPVLTPELADQLRSSLPALPRLTKSWSLLYSLDQHGVSLQTFYARCAVRVAGTLVAIRDSEDRTFGVWIGEQLRNSPGAYYGSGESFLWRSIIHHGKENVEVFKWTGKNDYVALCEAAFISFGGGEGKYGLYLDANLIDGSSARCPTFDNRVLCATAGHDENRTVPFECVGVEAWGVAN